MSSRQAGKDALRDRSAAWLAALLVVVILGWLGWSRVARLPLRDVTVEGAVMAHADRLLALARLESDSLLVSVSPSMVDDRVSRHPWVREARTNRLPDGTVSIRVTERTPVLLVLSASGRPEYYVDRDGHRMPYEAGHAFPVPVLRGFTEPYHPVRVVRNSSIRELVAVIPDLEPEVNALLSEFRYSTATGVDLVTTPTPTGETLGVHLGRSGFRTRFERLEAFWDQAVLTRPGVRYTSVDLRFDGQIITRESS